jgi:hypothetical protein
MAVSICHYPRAITLGLSQVAIEEEEMAHPKRIRLVSLLAG